MKGWLDKYNDNANEGHSSASSNWEGEGYSTQGRNYSPAWGGQFQKGGNLETPEAWEQSIRGVEHQIGNPSQWDIGDYLKLQGKLADYKNWRENTSKGRAVVDYHNEPNEYLAPIPSQLEPITKVMMKGLADGGSVYPVNYVPKAQNGNPPIITFNPKDPRLKAYNDSSVVYNYIQKWNALANNPKTTDEDIEKFFNQKDSINARKVGHDSNIIPKKIGEKDILSKKNKNSRPHMNIGYLPKPQPVVYREQDHPELISAPRNTNLPTTIVQNKISAPQLPSKIDRGNYIVEYIGEDGEWKESRFPSDKEGAEFMKEIQNRPMGISGNVPGGHIGGYYDYPRTFDIGGKLSKAQKGDKLDSLNKAKMRAKMALAAEFGNPAAKRMVSHVPPTYRFSGNETINGENVVGFGENQVRLPATGTHFMSSMGDFAVPYIQQGPSGSLQFKSNASPRDREAIRFDNPDDAEYFAEHYKEVAPMMQSFAMGGSIGGTLPGSTGFMYARVGAPSNGPYAKKTKASAQNGEHLKNYLNKMNQDYKDWYSVDRGHDDGFDSFYYDYLQKQDPMITETRSAWELINPKYPNEPWYVNESDLTEEDKKRMQSGKLTGKFIKDYTTTSRDTSMDQYNSQLTKYLLHNNKKNSKQKNGGMTYYQHGLDWKPKSISKNGSDIPIAQNGREDINNILNFAKTLKDSKGTGKATQKSEEERNKERQQSISNTFNKGKVSQASNVRTDEKVKQNVQKLNQKLKADYEQEEKEKQKRIAERKSALDFSKGKTKTFTMPDGRELTLDQMDSRDKWYVAGKSLEGKGRINEDDESLIDMFNPVNWTTEMAGALGEAPYEAKQTDSYLPYITSIANPLLMGRMMGSGSINPFGKKFWTNEVSNKEFLNNMAGGIPGLVKGATNKVGQSMESGLLSNLKRAPKPISLSSSIENTALPKITPEQWKEMSGYLQRRQFVKGLQKEGLVGKDFNLGDVNYAARSTDKTNKLTQLALDRYRTGYRGVQGDIGSGIGTQDNTNIGFDMNRVAYGNTISEVDNMINAGVDFTDPISIAKYQATHVPMETYGYRSGVPSMRRADALYTASEPGDWYGNYTFKVKKPTDFSQGNYADWFKKYYTDQPQFKGDVWQNLVNEGNAPSETVNYGKDIWIDTKGKKIADIDESFPFVKHKEFSDEQFKQFKDYREKILKDYNTGWRGQYKKGGVIEDDRGQWAHPGKITKINSNQITMKGVPYPVLGISDTGDKKMMYPEQEYTFKGKTVTEYPQKKKGGWLDKYN